MLYFDQKDYAAAAPYFLEAVKLGIESANVFNYLGICYSRTGDLRRAQENYRRALQLEPDLAEAHLNLAYAYQRTGQKADARREYAAACKLQESFCQFVPPR
jgi:Tfp pilus assembly protein PilF